MARTAALQLFLLSGPHTAWDVNVWSGKRSGFKCPYVEKKDCVNGDEAAINCGVAMVACCVATLRTRIHSGFAKTNSLSFLIGPPAENPKWLRVKTGLSIPLALLSKVLEASAETRLNSYAVPWISFDPRLVSTLTTPASALPNSAVKLLVKTETSPTESRG